jgi:hypothetical protein
MISLHGAQRLFPSPRWTASAYDQPAPYVELQGLSHSSSDS